MHQGNVTAYVVSFLLFVMTCSCIHAQDKILELWADAIPDAKPSKTFKEQLQMENGTLVRAEMVTTPTVSVFIPKTPNGTGILICPGGGYHHLAIHKEGTKVANWFNSIGITAFVLKYRLPSNDIMVNKHNGPLQDAQKAIRLVRQHAPEWQLDPNRIGVMGFSAGGHLAACLSNLYDSRVYASEDGISARPDFSILIYPVISMSDGIAHQGSKSNLLGTAASKDLVETFSIEKQVDALTPPTFLIHASNDRSVPVQNSIQYYEALLQYNVPVEMHIYENGGHGFGLGKAGTNQFWTSSLEHWLQQRELINK